jgi:hypothetical protein
VFLCDSVFPFVNEIGYCFHLLGLQRDLAAMLRVAWTEEILDQNQEIALIYAGFCRILFLVGLLFYTKQVDGR